MKSFIVKQVLYILLVLTSWGVIGYIAFHFILKFW